MKKSERIARLEAEVDAIRRHLGMGVRGEVEGGEKLGKTVGGTEDEREGLGVRREMHDVGKGQRRRDESGETWLVFDVDGDTAMVWKYGSQDTMLIPLSVSIVEQWELVGKVECVIDKAPPKEVVDQVCEELGLGQEDALAVGQWRRWDAGARDLIGFLFKIVGGNEQDGWEFRWQDNGPEGIGQHDFAEHTTILECTSPCAAPESEPKEWKPTHVVEFCELHDWNGREVVRVRPTHPYSAIDVIRDKEGNTKTMHIDWLKPIPKTDDFPAQENAPKQETHDQPAQVPFGELAVDENTPPRWFMHGDVGPWMKNTVSKIITGEGYAEQYSPDGVRLGSRYFSGTTLVTPCQSPVEEAEARGRMAGLEMARQIAKGCKCYHGGYHEPEELEVYYHGMGTVRNAIDAQIQSIESGQTSLQLSVVKASGGSPSPDKTLDQAKAEGRREAMQEVMGAWEKSHGGYRVLRPGLQFGAWLREQAGGGDDE